jgi:hypothetical protein
MAKKFNTHFQRRLIASTVALAIRGVALGHSRVGVKKVWGGLGENMVCRKIKNSRLSFKLQASTPASMVDILGCLESGVDEILSVTKIYEAVSLSFSQAVYLKPSNDEVEQVTEVCHYMLSTLQGRHLLSVMQLLMK